MTCRFSRSCPKTISRRAVELRARHHVAALGICAAEARSAIIVVVRQLGLVFACRASSIVSTVPWVATLLHGRAEKAYTTFRKILSRIANILWTWFRFAAMVLIVSHAAAKI
jgi:hypothetical protein